jgi:outer membrane receptor for ferrienterochelin and colicins
MKKGLLSLFSGLLTSLLAVTISYGQKAFITVTDQKSHEPVAFAHVCLEGLKTGAPRYCLTSIDGRVTNDIREVSKMVISYVGYTTFIDTLRPGESREIQLKPTILNMDEVVVTAQYTPERVDKSIYKVEVINAREIEQKAATNMNDLLKDEVGMRVSDDGVLGTSLTIQGLSGENVKFLIDGIPMIGRMNGNIDLNQISLYNVDHVEIIEGPMSVIYGSNALAGVVNIITKENSSAVLNTTANVYTESVDRFNFDAGVTYNFRKHGISVDGGRNFFGGYPDYEESRVQDFKPRRQFFFDGYYTYTADRLKIKLAGQYFNELLISRGALLPPYEETAFDTYFNTIRYSGRAEVSVKLPRKYFLTLMAAYSGYDRDKATWYKDLTTLEEVRTNNPEDQDTTTIESLIARGTFARSNPDRKFNFQAGVDINVERGTGKRIYEYEQMIGDYAAFLSVKWDPVKVFSIQPGVRFIYNTKYQAPVVYALSAKWNITPRFSARASWSHGFRAPSVKELYLYFVDINHNIQGNPDLKAETSNNVNLNLNYTAERNKLAYSADLTLYYNVIENIITLAQQTSDLYTYINVDQYKTTGLQINTTFGFYPSLKVQLGLAETGRYSSLSEETDAGDSFYFSTDLNASISYRFLKPEITLSAYYKYTGRMPQFFMQDNTVVEGYVDGYNTLDFTATKGFWQNRIRLSCGAKNIFNNKVIPAVGSGGGAHSSGGGDGVSVGYGRTYFVKLSFVFNKYK